ncbi:MAG: hypothetical protein WAZ98_05825 [Cyclobacteriaceae bacterium]
MKSFITIVVWFTSFDFNIYNSKREGWKDIPLFMTSGTMDRQATNRINQFHFCGVVNPLKLAPVLTNPPEMLSIIEGLCSGI